MEIRVQNVNNALAAGLRYLYEEGVEENSRNGKVIVAPEPVTTIYSKPWERVLFSPTRDANPFFHMFEALHMLAGRNDIAFLAQFAKNMLNYSDDGVKQRGAYGHRWRRWFGYDQLQVIVEELRRDPESRRCVLGMWDAGETCYWQQLQFDKEDRKEHPEFMTDGRGDLRCTSKDKPCNTHIYVDCRGGRLNITVCCRSNDIWWGAYGANAVHFSVLQEYLAAWVGVPMGVYRQMSNNYHIYTSMVPRERFIEQAEEAESHNWYRHTTSEILFTPLLNGLEKPYVPEWTKNVEALLLMPAGDWFLAGILEFEFLASTALFMLRAWQERKSQKGTGEHWANQIEAPDWRKACVEWIARKEARKAQKESATA